MTASEELRESLEHWLRTDGVERYDAYHRDFRASKAADIFARLRQHHAGTSQGQNSPTSNP